MQQPLGSETGASITRSWASRVGAAGTAALVSSALVLPAGNVVGSAQAIPLPLSPDDPTVAEQWINPLLRPGESDSQVSLQLVESQPTVITPGQPVKVTLELQNHTEQTISDLQLQPQRADAATSTWQARQLLSFESSTYPWFGGSEEVAALAPGETRQVHLELPTDPGVAGTLSIGSTGIYPVLLSLSGILADGGQTRFSTERFLLNATADGEAGADPAATGPAAPDPTAEPVEPTAPMTMLYPISADTDILPGETGDSPGDTPLVLGSEQLATELSPNGRLDQLLGHYREAVAADGGQALRSASCLAIDPELLDTVDRMSRGYTVDDSRQIDGPQSRRLRDSWTQPDDPDPATPGIGQAEAAAWLTELRDTTADSCVVALPWSNADLDAVHATGNQWLMREALERGYATISQILDVEPVRNVVIPGSGYTSPATAPALGWAERPATQGQAGDQAADAGGGEDPRQAGSANDADAAEPGTNGEQGAVAETTAEQADPLEAAWEEQAAAVAGTAGTPGVTEEPDTLEDTTPPDVGAAALPQPPETTVNVLVANNTVWSSTQVGRFAELAPGITAVTYQDSLAATLAATGRNPVTVGYSNPDSRFDYRIDSATARDHTAAAMVALAAAELHSAAEGAGEVDPLMIVPPANLSAATAGALLDSARQLLTEETVSPLSFSDFLSPSPEQQDQLSATQPISGPDATAFGAPFDDPTVFSDAEILRTAQQANYIDDFTRIMTNDPVISLTRYQFTAPLRRDLLTALSGTHRRSMSTFNADVAHTDERLTGNRLTLQNLRSSVSLIPPGNVYTRTSESSPLLIVAENRLPLPTRATISYSGPEGAELNIPSDIRIPAMGSITLQLTADLPEDQDRTDLTLRLATLDGAAISDPVEISVQTRSGLVGTSSAVAALIVALVLALIFRIGSHRKRRAARHQAADSTATKPSACTKHSSNAPPRGTPRRGAGQADENSGSPKPPGHA